MTKRIKDIVPQSPKSHSKKIVIETPDNEQSFITLKAQGLTAASIGILIFTVFWNGFLVVWTTLAASASIAFALFSIPFWLVGLTMFFGLLTSFFGYQELLVRRKDLIIRKYVLIFRIEHIIPYSELESIELENHMKYKKKTYNSMKMVASGANDSGLTSKTPTVVYGDNYEFFGEHLRASDKEWLVDYLNDKIVPLLNYVR